MPVHGRIDGLIDGSVVLPAGKEGEREEREGEKEREKHITFMRCVYALCCGGRGGRGMSTQVIK